MKEFLESDAAGPFDEVLYLENEQATGAAMREAGRWLPGEGHALAGSVRDVCELLDAEGLRPPEGRLALRVAYELRSQPFFGWITDLSAPDPTSLFNLFGLIPISLPAFLMIGVWPILMGISMWVQMKLNPAPTDPMQQKIFTWMPVFFTFLLATFPAGLVIYWTWNNILSVAQQWVIMARQGVKVELFDNIKGSFAWLKRNKATDET